MSKSLLFQSFKCYICEVLIGCLSAATILSVSAYSYTEGNESVMSPPNRTYYAYNSLSTGKQYGQKYARASTHVYTDDNVPGGYMGVKPALYDSNDNLIMTKDWYYSINNVYSHMDSVADYSITGTPAVYSQGRARVWNPSISDYWTYATFRTPYLNDYT